eukprot:5309572-Pyramimonas_sp.AAC.1
MPFLAGGGDMAAVASACVVLAHQAKKMIRTMALCTCSPILRARRKYMLRSSCILSVLTLIRDCRGCRPAAVVRTGKAVSMAYLTSSSRALT